MTAIETKVEFPKSFGALWQQMMGDGAAAHPLIQFIKYGLVGGLSTIVDMIAFFVFAWFVFPSLTESDFLVKILSFIGITVPTADVSDSVRATRSLICSVIAFGFSNTVCYLINFLWVFKPGRYSRKVEMLLFFLVSGASMGIGSGIAYVCVRWFGMQTSISYLTKVVAAILINYVARKKFVFKG